MARSQAGLSLLFLLVAALCISSAVATSKSPKPSWFDKWVDHHCNRYKIAKHEYKKTGYATFEEAIPTNDATVLDTDSVGTDAVGGRTMVVDGSGRGNFKTVQQAINAVPNGNKYRVTIYIRAGVYRQKILIPSTKPLITFVCARKSILVWGDTAGKAGGTSKSASIAIESDGFIARGCTFANSAPAPSGGAVGKQAVALRIKGDKGAFYGCSFYGAQDTLYDQLGRHYFRSCFIQGSIDFIFGDGTSLYVGCVINSIAFANSGSVTAQNRASGSENSGFSFVSCRLQGSGSIYLGRAWGIYSRVVFIRCYFANMITPIGWQDWNDPARHRTVFYGEYLCTGPGSNRRGRAPWSRELTFRQAQAFEYIAFIGGQYWLPSLM